MITDKLIEIAKSEIGYLEKSKAAVEADPSVLYDFKEGAGRDNYTKYAVEQWAERYFNGKKQGVAWCAVFVGWCFLKAYGKDKALRLQCQPRSGNAGAGCGAASNYYKQKNRWRSDPEKGDQIFFTDGKQMTHTGLVEYVEGNKVHTIEGNCDDGVRRRSYDLNAARIAGYGHPDWTIMEEEGETDMEQAKVVLPSGASGSTVNMRKQPSKSAELREQVPVGSTVEVIEDQGQWCKVAYDGKTGWMMSNYLEYLNQDGQPDTDANGVLTLTAEEVKAINAALTTAQNMIDTIGSIIGRG